MKLGDRVRIIKAGRPEEWPVPEADLIGKTGILADIGPQEEGAFSEVYTVEMDGVGEGTLFNKARGMPYNGEEWCWGYELVVVGSPEDEEFLLRDLEEEVRLIQRRQDANEREDADG